MAENEKAEASLLALSDDICESQRRDSFIALLLKQHPASFEKDFAIRDCKNPGHSLMPN